MLSIIIPTLNAEPTLGATIDSCGSDDLRSTITVSDGGSKDGTLSLAASHDCKIVQGSAGRGTQLAVGADAAVGDWLLFIHADSRLPKGWSTHVAAFMNDPTNQFHAASFHLRYDDHSPQARRIEWLVKWRTRLLALPYGDQGLLISRVYYNRLGGFKSIPIMEDVDLIRRIGRHNLRTIDAPITTSAQKYRRDGYWKRPIKNLSLMCLYRLGVSTTRLADLYR